MMGTKLFKYNSTLLLSILNFYSVSRTEFRNFLKGKYNYEMSLHSEI